MGAAVAGAAAGEVAFCAATPNAEAPALFNVLVAAAAARACGLAARTAGGEAPDLSADVADVDAAISFGAATAGGETPELLSVVFAAAAAGEAGLEVGMGAESCRAWVSLSRPLPRPTSPPSRRPPAARCRTP